ncbi:MAG: 50S ribosomal protein L1 [Candidatus Coatesbacteria bacterium]
MSKRFEAVVTSVDRTKRYAVPEAVAIVKKCATAKFDETVELTVRLGIDPKQSDQAVRTAAVLPHGSGTTRKVLVLAKGEKEKEAQAAGADYVGAEDLIEKISKGWLDFDVVIATPDLMRAASPLGKVLGPRGLMPNPKSGTVTMDVGRIVKESKAGRLELRNDSYGIIHAAVGKASFPAEHLVANAGAVMEVLMRMRPPAAKGAYVRRVFLSSTMGPGVEVDANAFAPQEV